MVPFNKGDIIVTDVSMGKISRVTNRWFEVLWDNGNYNRWYLEDGMFTCRLATKAEITLYWPSPDPIPDVITTSSFLRIF
jgi:hypothetical protein